jgi:pre-mRNA-processing factor 40
MSFLFEFFRALDSEVYAKELFEECVVHLKERLKEKERLREEEKVMATIHGFYAL